MHTKDWEPCYNSGSDSVGLVWGLILTFLTSRCPVDHTEQQGLDSCLGLSVLSLEATMQTGYPGTMHAHAGEGGQMVPS